MLVIEKLRKNFGARCAVKDISFSVGKGETVGLLGPNGAGKTTTIAMICGIAKADAGRVTLDGAAITPESRALKQRVGLVPQDLALYEELSAWANIELFGGLYGITGALLEQRGTAALQLVGLADRRREAIRNFSGGMKRRVNIACALLHDPDVSCWTSQPLASIRSRATRSSRISKRSSVREKRLSTPRTTWKKPNGSATASSSWTEAT